MRVYEERGLVNGSFLFMYLVESSENSLVYILKHKYFSSYRRILLISVHTFHYNENLYRSYQLKAGTLLITTALIISNAVCADVIRFEVSCCFFSLRSKCLHNKAKDMTKNKHLEKKRPTRWGAHRTSSRATREKQKRVYAPDRKENMKTAKKKKKKVKKDISLRRE